MLLAAALAALVAGLLALQNHPRTRGIFQWLPLPLWCYAVPVIAVQLGILPRDNDVYGLIAAIILPFALALLMLGTDIPSVLSTGPRALGAAVIGSAGILLGAPLGAWLLSAHLPEEAWKGAGALAGTWTGGTMNLLALRAVLGLTDPVFAPLIVVDAVIAYGWMALLVAASGAQPAINRWLGATAAASSAHRAHTDEASGSIGMSIILALIIAIAGTGLGRLLPKTSFINAGSGWAILMVSTLALAASMNTTIRHIGAAGPRAGYPALYLVLAATGAQGNLHALIATPAWLGLGLITVAVHAAALVIAGKAFKIPLGLLATASQANIGGVVSAPLVGAVYHKSLAPIGLLLAVAGNALGTYLGLLAASLAKLGS